MITVTREQIVGSKIVEISHSDYSKPEFVIEGIGPASFRSHYLLLDNGLVVELFTAELSFSKVTSMRMIGETEGVPIVNLVGRSVTDVWRDDVFSCIVILDNSIYLKDANDGVYGNPLRAGFIVDDYSGRDIDEFVDYWTEKPIKWERTRK